MSTVSVEWTGVRSGHLVFTDKPEVVPFIFDEVTGFLSCLFHGGKRAKRGSYQSFESYTSTELEEFAAKGFCAIMQKF